MRSDEWPPKERTLHRWTHAGLECAVCKSTVAMCGYVMVPESHPFYGKGGYEDEVVDVRIHGGLTFAEGAPNGWWFGFDCAHGGDAMGLDMPLFEEDEKTNLLRGVFSGGVFSDFHRGDRVWEMDDVIRETCLLAEQLADATREKT